MYVYIYIYIYICMYLYECVYIYMYVCMYVYECVYIYIYVYECVYVYICICMYMSVYVCMYMSVYIYMYVCMYMSVYIYVCMYMSVSVYIYIYVCMYKLYNNYTSILRAILNTSWRQHPKRNKLYGHLPTITKTIQVGRSRHGGHYWRSKDELISDVLLWTPEYGQPKAGRPTRTSIQQLCEDTGYSYEYLSESMNDREKSRGLVRDIRASGTT